MSELAAQAVDPELRLQHALDVAFRYLGRRERTTAEVRGHLEAKQVEPATIDEAVAELRRTGYLDDAGYAQRFAEDRRTLDSWGADRIERKLRQVGIAPDLVRAALDARDAAGELDAAVAVIVRRYPEPLADDRTRQKALGVLVRRGYGLELAHQALRLHAAAVTD